MGTIPFNPFLNRLKAKQIGINIFQWDDNNFGGIIRSSKVAKRMRVTFKKQIFCMDVKS